MNGNAFNNQFLPPGYVHQPHSQAPVGAQPGPPPPGYWQAQQPWVQQGMYAPPALPGLQQGMPAPQWVRQPQAQEQPPPTVGDQHAFLQGVVTAVAAELGKKNASKEIARSTGNDRIVVDAVKKGRSKGLSPREAIEKLGNANGHANALWKDYFLDRLQTLVPKLFPNVGSATGRRGGPSQALVQRTPPSSSSRAPAHARRALPVIGISGQSTPSSSEASPSFSFRDRRLGPEHQSYQPSSPFSEQGGPTSVRSRRGDPVDQFHAGTPIPRFDALSQPKPPTGDHRDAGNKFTDEDKVFFIHFLMWYLREGPVPSKEVVYRMLAGQTPHHNADAWKRHWSDQPELPDKIYIAALKREDDEAVTSRSSSPSSGHGYEDVAADDGSFGSTFPVQAGLSDHQVCGLRRPKGGVKVTEDDLRAMAQYKRQRQHVWDQYPTRIARWEEFAERPENLKRSANAWSRIERDRSDVLDRYDQEYATAAADHGVQGPGPEPQHTDVDTSPLADRDRASASSETRAAEDGALTTVPQKRRAESESARSVTAGAGPGPDFPAPKRIKEKNAKEEPIEIDSD